MPSDDRQLRWCDGHLDLAYLAVNGRDLRRDRIDPATGCVTLPALREANVRWTFGTIFTEMGLEGADRAHRYADHDDLDGAERAGFLQLEFYERMAREGAVRLIRTRDDLDQHASPLATLILMEGADPIRSPEAVARWHARGLRMIGLSWALGSRYAGGNSTGGPLTDMGLAMIDALDDLGVIHDASHLSDAAFDGLMRRTRGRIVATHSNCRTLLEPKERHLRDDQIRAIVQRDGIIGLNLYGRFLAAGRRATLSDCLAHVEHVAEVAGTRRVVALGSDMDGGFGPRDLPEGVDHPSKLAALADGLRSRGWSDDDVVGFTHGNWLRFLREALPE